MGRGSGRGSCRVIVKLRYVSLFLSFLCLNSLLLKGAEFLVGEESGGANGIEGRGID